MNTSTTKAACFRPFLILISSLGAVLLASCASTTNRPPSPGMAVIDATPDAERRDRIDGIRIASINGASTRGSKQELEPGKNKVRVGFNWPQGGNQEVDLPFVAKPNKTYVVYYDVHPPYANRLVQPGMIDATFVDVAEAAAGADRAAILFFPPLVTLGTAAIAKRISNEIAEDSRAANYVDVMVVAQQSSQGIACCRRVYPDGRVVNR